MLIATTLLVAPFVQDVRPTSAWVVWEASDAGPAEVRWGDGQVAAAEVVWAGDGSAILQAPLTGLSPGASVTYTVAHGDAVSGPWTFRAAAGDGAPVTRLVAVSDMQRASADPTRWGDVSGAIVAWADRTFGPPVSDALDAVLVAGDLVEDGTRHADWTDDFFGLSHPLPAQVQILPVLGNHEQDADWYFRYFHLPDEDGGAERWWHRQLGNVLILGLDSNLTGIGGAQLDWLDARLGAACDDPSVDFVLAQLHHPFESELWVPGNNPWVGQTQARLSAFATTCGRPAVTLFGHTHGYARGQVRDHAHLLMNVASAGGALDRWGQTTQRDYEAFTISDDSFGWVAIEATAGDDPTLVLRRFSRGDGGVALDDVEIDRVELRRGGAAPPAPAIVAPAAGAVVGGDCAWLEATPYGGAEVHQATHWQIAAGCDRFDDPLIDLWDQAENVYFGVDTRRGAPLDQREVDDLGDGARCARVRYRDAALRWSAWSASVAFTATAPTRTREQLVDGSGEAGTLADWQTEGAVQLAGDGRCDMPEPWDGGRVIGLGSPCGAEAPARLWQEGVVPRDRPGDVAIVAGAHTGGEVTLTLRFAAEDGAPLGEASATLASAAAWTPFEERLPLPAGARRVTWEAAGAGALLDALSLRYGQDVAVDCAPRRAPAPAAADPAACGCRHGSGGAWAVAVVAWRRRRSRPPVG